MKVNSLSVTVLKRFRKAIYLVLWKVDRVILGHHSNLVIFCYHSVAKRAIWKFTVPLGEFKKQIEYLLKEGYVPMTIDDIQQFLKLSRPIPQKAFVLTFDDGYADNMELIPFLKEKQIKPTVFLITDRKNVNRRELDNELPLLSTGEVKKLQRSGWEIGCHSFTHADFGNLDADQIFRETSLAKKKLENEFKIKIKYFAYPKGKYSQELIDELKKCGYKMAVSMNDEVLKKSKSNPFCLPRVGIDRSHDLEEFRCLYSPSAFVFRKLFKWTNLWKYVS